MDDVGAREVDDVGGNCGVGCNSGKACGCDPAMEMAPCRVSVLLLLRCCTKGRVFKEASHGESGAQGRHAGMKGGGGEGGGGGGGGKKDDSSLACWESSEQKD